MPKYILSKSDFVLAHSCPTKLYYRKKGYPSADDQNEYMRHLARGGYMVGKLATLLQPDGILIETGSDQKAAIELTREHLKKKDVVLFEAAIESRGKLVRVDILKKIGNFVSLVEVKSKSYETTSDPKRTKKIFKELDDYILDVAYQYLVLKEAYPDWDLKSFLMLPDKAKRTRVDGLNLMFRIEDQPQVSGSRFRRYNVTVEPDRLEEVINDDLMTIVDVQVRVLELQESIKSEIVSLLASLESDLEKIKPELCKDCFKCEFNVSDETHRRTGFDECWAGYPSVQHHIKDLYYMGSIGGWKDPLANRLIAEKKISLFDVPVGELNGELGKRQVIQIDGTRSGKEWFSSNIRADLKCWMYPLRFIDFETAVVALPFHKGMRPYEVVAFQWSCHTIQNEGAEPTHGEWINLDPAFPNFRFAEALMAHVGLEGTFLMWAPYENTILNAIRNQCVTYGYSNEQLRDWLDKVVKTKGVNEGKFIDMNRFTLENYFHPRMKGKTSLKWTLPAVLWQAKAPRIDKWLGNVEPGFSLLAHDADGRRKNPYKLLPPVEIYERAESVEDGTGAMRAYEDLMFGLNKNRKDVADSYARALLRYCKLDTLAMVMVWEHWRTS